MTSIPRQLDAIARLLPKALLADRVAALKVLRRLKQDHRYGKYGHVQQARRAELAERITASVALRDQRFKHRPHLRFDTALPIVDKRDEIIAAIGEHAVIIVAGQTGSGKTTQLPKMCLAAGRGIDGIVGVTQPRRIAATTVSRRIAQEMNEQPGNTVGYKIRFQDATGRQNRIKVMTDGILLAEAHHDPHLNQYDTLIVDEAHERSLNIDFILGILKQLLVRRPDLKVIITSATIDTDKFAAAFDQAPVIEVVGRLYPVETRYSEQDDEHGTHIEMAIEAVGKLEQERKFGDILIFMPTEQDIRDTCDALEGRRAAGTLVIPLFARLSAAEQRKVFLPAKARKIIVATNVAETSITIPGINYVIDTGLARISQYRPRSRTTTLPVQPIARDSADQRQGRCGRMANGICIRLYSQEDYDNRPQFTAPEILRANLAEVILRMLALRLGDVDNFAFVDPPARRSIQDGYKLLLELGAIAPGKRSKSPGAGYRLTPKGRLMAQLPLDPRLACMLIEARGRKCLDDVAIICAALSIQDPRERPSPRQAEADQAQARFVVPASDFITLLRIWHAYGETVSKRKSWRQVKQFCRDHFLSFRRMREWRDIHRQILSLLADQNIRPSTRSRPPDTDACTLDNPWYAAIHQSILYGFLSNIAVNKERQIYQASHNRQVMLFPGSGLFKHPAPWIVAAEMVATSRLYARCAAMVNPDWLETIGKEQCKYTYLDPHWERKRGQVVATEQVTLFGLMIARRQRPCGKAQPEEATRIFIHDALIKGDLRQPPPFMVHNLEMLDAVEDMQNRLRRKDLRIDDQLLLEFYQRRLGHIYDLRTLMHRIRKAGSDDFLRLREEDLLRYRPDREELGQFPDHISVDRQRIQCQYRFAPGKQEDGVTAKVPVSMAATLNADAFQWLVPGLLEEKITALIKALPKEYRKKLAPVAQTAKIIAAEMPPGRRIGLTNAISQLIRKRFGTRIPATAWNISQLPDHLRMRIALTDECGGIIESSRDAAILDRTDSGSRPSVDFNTIREKWQRPVESWDFGDLSDSLSLKGPDGRTLTGYPALEACADEVMLTIFADRAQAAKAHARGVKALYLRRFSRDIKFLSKNLLLPTASDAACRYFGGRQELERQLRNRVVDELFLKEFRSQEAFQAHGEQLERAGIAGQGRARRDRVIDLLSTYLNLRLQLHTLRVPGTKKPVGEFLAELDRQINELMPQNFVQLYASNRLPRLLHYLQAIGLRARRGVVDLEKDQAKASRVEPFTKHLNRMVTQLTSRTSKQKRRAVEEFFWLIEEYKISVFAQEIKTAQPISAKRLNKRIEEIDSLV